MSYLPSTEVKERSLTDKQQAFLDNLITTGGYPKIANVIAVDLCKVGQLKPGDEFKFQLISMDEAEELYFEQESFFQKFTGASS